VEISGDAEKLRVHRELLRAVFGAVQGQVSRAGLAAFAPAEQTEYLASVSHPSDLSAEATAQRILDGIGGYVIRAFRAQNLDATWEQAECFRQQVLRGVNQGIAEAKRAIADLGMLDPELASSIEEIAERVREGLPLMFTEASIAP
jgi:hypothetical protein